MRKQESCTLMEI